MKILYITLISTIFLVGIFANSGIYPSYNPKNKDLSQYEELKFIIVGDPQINYSTGEGIDRLKQVVSFSNKQDVDFVVFMGDMTDDGKEKSNDIVKYILKDLKKPYYVVVGNHDIYVSPKIFESYYGPMEHIENVKGYQLLFIGINDGKNENGIVNKLNWSFDFNKANKDIPTLVFIHGPVKSIATGCGYCRLQKDVIGYGYSIRPELNKFTNLIGVYSGHVHYDSNQISNGTRYVTINGLIDIEVMRIPVAKPSNNIGYSIIKGNKSSYELISYDV